MRYLLNYVAVLGMIALVNDCGKPAQPTASNEELSPPTQFHYSQVVVLFTGGYADPSVIQMPDATFLMYLNRFGETGTGTFILSSDDAVSWKVQTDIVFRGVATGRGFRFSNGLRFYYPQLERPPQFEGDEPPRNIVSSFSSDGISDWQDEGVLVVPRPGYSLGGPTVIRLKDGSYRMFFDEQDLSTIGPGKVLQGEIYAASSKDALMWTRDEAPTIVYEEDVEGVGQGSHVAQVLHPFAMAWPDGGYLMFYTSHSRIFAAYSQDGFRWEKLGHTGIRGADADAIFLADGTLRIYFGDFTPETSGIVYTAVLEVE
ncbi:MAG: hypothetical protein ACE5IW_08750 [bacterium]